MTAGVDTLLRDALREWQAAYRRTLKGGARRRDVHAWRVATRGLLTIADAALSKPSRRRVERELRRSFRAAGRLRDAQVGIELARDVAPGNACATELASWLAHRLPRRRRRLLRRLREVDRRDVSRIVERGVRRARRRPEAARAFALERCDDALRRVRRERAGLTLRSPAADVHRLRLAVKRARYLSRYVGDLAGLGRYAAVARRLARHQRALGAVADLIVLEGQVARFARRHPERAREGTSLGRELHGRQRSLVREALRGFPVSSGATSAEEQAP